MEVLGAFLVAAVVSAAGVTLVCGLPMRRARGPMHRAIRHLAGLLAVFVALDFWCAALGLLGVQRGGWPASTWYGAAIGASGEVLLSFLLLRTAGPGRTVSAVRGAVTGTLEVLAVSWLCTITLLFGLDFHDGVKSWSRELPGASSPLVDLLRADLLAFAFAQLLTNIFLKGLSEGSAE
jgi:hypothetical protein